MSSSPLRQPSRAIDHSPFTITDDDAVATVQQHFLTHHPNHRDETAGTAVDRPHVDDEDLDLGRRHDEHEEDPDRYHQRSSIPETVLFEDQSADGDIRTGVSLVGEPTTAGKTATTTTGAAPARGDNNSNNNNTKRWRSWSWSARGDGAEEGGELLSTDTTPSVPTTMSSMTGIALSVIHGNSSSITTTSVPLANATIIGADHHPPETAAISIAVLRDPRYDPERVQWERERLDLQQRNLDLERRQWELEQQQRQQSKNMKSCICIVVAALLIALGFAIGMLLLSSSTTTSTTTPAPTLPDTNSTMNLPDPPTTPSSSGTTPLSPSSPSSTTVTTTAPPSSLPPLSRADLILSFVNKVTLSGRTFSYRGSRPTKTSAAASKFSDVPEGTLITATTAEERAIQWLIDEDTNTTVYDERMLRQRYALTTLWFQPNGALSRSADHVSTWAVPAVPECNWFNIACVDGEVTMVSLALDATKLLQDAAIVDDIPGVLGRIIPTDDFGLLTALTYVNLGGTNSNATVAWPPSSSTSVGGGFTTIPSSLGALTRLTHLSVKYSALTGTIPPSIGFLTALTALDFSYNQLTGIIPSSLTELTTLVLLDLSSNQLTGSLSSSLSSLEALVLLRLSDNRLTGTIPPSLASLTDLHYVTLRSNQVTGTVPSTLASLTKLTGFAVYNNNITGTMPFCVAIGNNSNTTTADSSINSSRFIVLGADCMEVQCVCCKSCCPANGWKGIPGNAYCDE